MGRQQRLLQQPDGEPMDEKMGSREHPYNVGTDHETEGGPVHARRHRSAPEGKVKVEYNNDKTHFGKSLAKNKDVCFIFSQKEDKTHTNKKRQIYFSFLFLWRERRKDKDHFGFLLILFIDSFILFEVTFW